MIPTDLKLSVRMLPDGQQPCRLGVGGFGV